MRMMICTTTKSVNTAYIIGTQYAVVCRQSIISKPQ